jgi:DEAD/DEAH box helicase domain-containing protein
LAKFKGAESLRQAYVRYYETAYQLEDKLLTEERRQLLLKEGYLMNQVFIEPVMKYDESIDFVELITELGLPMEDSQRAMLGLMDWNADVANPKLRNHHADSLRVHFANAPQASHLGHCVRQDRSFSPACSYETRY